MIGISAVLIGVASGIGEGAGGNGDNAVGDAVLSAVGVKVAV
jgi:hypothetical protein